ncbi:response regulator [Chromatiaceae bacterium AAb-1]|nr:response regulator [Chromatiaceae bacterium AAb-1]
MKLVLVDDDEVLLRTLSRRMTQQGWQVFTFAELDDVRQLTDIAADAYLLDLRFGEQSGLSFVPVLRQALPASRIIMLTGYGSITTAVQAVKLGADNYLTKPVDFSSLLNVLAGKEPSPVAADAGVLSPEQLEWEYIQRVLEQQQGNISQTARLLGMHRRTLQRKLAKHRP